MRVLRRGTETTMNRHLPYLPVLPLLLVPLAASAQTVDTERAQFWLGVLGSGPLGARSVLQLDAQYRGFEDLTPTQILLRGALLYRVAPELLVGGGYAWTPSFRGRDFVGATDEHRAFLQLQWDPGLDALGLRFSLRTRLEGRLRHPADAVELGLRARQLVRAAWPITADRRLLAIVWDELFVHAADSGGGETAEGPPTRTPRWAAAGVDQNRLFVGLGLVVVPTILRLEGGYMMQWVHRPLEPLGDLVGHTALVWGQVGWSG
jgi:hypothetical protein